MPESNVELININTFQDIEVYFDKLTKGENVAIGDISENITVAIKLDGGRFINYEAPFVDAVIANMIIAHQDAYKKIVKQLRKDYGITNLSEELLLQFKLEQGCCEAELKEINNFLEIIKDMPVEAQIASIASLIIGLLGVGAYWLIKQKMADNKEIALTQIQNTHASSNLIEQNRHTEAIVSTIDKMITDIQIEKAVNYPKEKTLKKLNVDENLSYQRDDGRTTQVTKNEITNYESTIQEPEPQEIETTETITIKVAAINYGDDQKMVKIVGNTQLFSRDFLPVPDRIKLASKADNNEQINVSVKFFKDQKGKILRAYLLSIVE